MPAEKCDRQAFLDAAEQEYFKVARQGDAEAQFNLGVLYDHERKDHEEAIKWYRKAAEKGYAPAQYNLGIFHLQGMGTEKNLDYAFMWLSMAATQGFDGANAPRAHVRRKMTASQIELANTLFTRCLSNNFKGCEQE